MPTRDGVRERARKMMSPETGASARRAAAKAAAMTRRGYSEVRAAGVLRRAGVIDLRPSEAAAEMRAVSTYGQLGAPLIIAARKFPERTGLIDELGSLTYAEMHQRTEALAAALARRGVSDDDCLGVMCANHRGFLDITFAAAKLGARIVYLNTDFSGPELCDVCEQEAITLLVHDEEYGDRVGDLELSRGTVLAWHDRAGDDEETLENLIRTGTSLPAVPAPSRHTRVVSLTSGTTGPPKGAERSGTPSLAPVAAMMSKVPYRVSESTYLAPPMHHGVGYSQMLLAVSLGCTLIVERRFDPERMAAAVTAHRPSTLVLVPVMLRRLLGVLERSLNRYDLSSLRIVFVSGAALEPELVRRAQASLGRVLYNFYGSTEVGYVSFATPEDLRAAPGCAGRPPFGTVIRLYDENGEPVRGADCVGAIHVGNSLQFDGYTSGGSPSEIDGLMSTGDVGHFDSDGRLWVDGREDDMVVSGGENVFPGEVEGLLGTHPAIDEASVIGVEDAEFGQRLAAFVVLSRGQELTGDQVQEFVKAHLARFKVPRDVVFLSDLPRNPTGKVLKRALRDYGRRSSP